ncbi:unnamed protein product [Brachionus calyciflorus]|uniref:Outer membrane lipoprotein carrier protein LolA n=1 Tax=Brachionus calyciflorus TaxID=104777 RepID=A0A814NJP3_9BILA|nr:unnamed protein product [Brachionus calyciflorus]
MELKLIFLLMLIQGFNSYKLNESDAQIECAIFNNLKKDHLFAENLVFESFQDRDVYTREIPIKYLLNNGIYFKEHKEGLWIFEPAKSLGKNIFLLRNKKYDEYLYADDSESSLFASKTRREVHTKKIKLSIDKAYVWAILKTSQSGVFKIVNMKYGEMLEGEDISKNKIQLSSKRDCWTSKILDADDKLTNWYLFCHNNALPVS